jgi:broad specificity phosphatase PhoE
MWIFLIRHGETASNAARIVQTPETPLTERGLAQVDRLAQRLAEQGVASILSSDLPRAAVTAARLRAVTGAPIELDQGLRERNYGDIRGRAYAVVGVNILALDYEPPGGETWADFHARVDAVWDRIVEASAHSAGNLAVVTHGLVCYSLALRHLSVPHDAAPPLHWRNASLTVIEARPPWKVRLLNCTAHLDFETDDATRSSSDG